MTPAQLQALIEFIRAAAWEAAEVRAGDSSPARSDREERALREAFVNPIEPKSNPIPTSIKEQP